MQSKSEEKVPEGYPSVSFIQKVLIPFYVALSFSLVLIPPVSLTIEASKY